MGKKGFMATRVVLFPRGILNLEMTGKNSLCLRFVYDSAVERSANFLVKSKIVI